MIEIAIIGGGNVAYHFFQCFKKLVDYKVTQVYTRSQKTDVSWAEGVEVIYDLSNIKKVNLYLIAVSDRAINSVIEKLKIDKHSVVVHTSGAEDMTILEDVSKNIGVLYPLQTLLKNEEENYSELPLFIESNNECSRFVLEKLANGISTSVEYATSEDRLKYHAMAVFTQNFSQFLTVQADEFLNMNGLSFEKLIPLLRKNINRLDNSVNRVKMTGPAIRGDKKTIDKHLYVLKDKTNMSEIYAFMSKKIEESRDAS